MSLELIRISGDKIKISLTKEDLLEYKITVEKMDYSEKETQKIFRKLLSEAKSQTGFDAGSARVFIHIYQSSDGGCEIFVSKIASGKEQKPHSHGKRKTGYFVFESLENLIKLCAQLKILGFKGSSSALREAENRYWLRLVAANSYHLAYAFEYGARSAVNVSESYLSEHCKVICKKRAVETLGAFS